MPPADPTDPADVNQDDGHPDSAPVRDPASGPASDPKALLADLQRRVADGIAARAIAEGRDPATAAQTFLAEELLAERAAEARREELLMGHYTRMFPHGGDDPADADGLATDRALTAAAAVHHGHEEDA